MYSIAVAILAATSLVTPAPEHWSAVQVLKGHFGGGAFGRGTFCLSTDNGLLVLDQSLRRKRTLPIKADYIKLDERGEIFVKRPYSVKVYAPSGQLLKTIGSKGKGPNRFELGMDNEGNDDPAPQYFDIGPDGTLYCFDSAAGQVKLFSKNGSSKAAISAGRQSFIQGFAVDSSGNVFLSEIEPLRVEEFSRSGKMIRSFGRQGHGPGTFTQEPTEGPGPGALAVTSNGTVFAVDNYGDKVEVFRRDGSSLGSVRLANQDVRELISAEGEVYAVTALGLWRLQRR
jgi:hypothetical protein